MGVSFMIVFVLLFNVVLSGEFKIGSFKGVVVLVFDIWNFIKSMIVVSFNRIELDDLFKMVVDKKM